MLSEVIRQMRAFYQVIVKDARISPTHISIYMALLNRWDGVKANPLALHRPEIMRAAKISARQTYNKCMNELKAYGYIRYIPSRGNGVESVIYLIGLNERRDDNES